MLRAEAREASQQEPGRKDDLDRDPELRLPAGRESARRALERTGLLEQRFRAPIEHLAGRREVRLAADDLEYFDPEERLHLLHGVGHRGLALVQGESGLGVAAGVDHGEQGAPLLQGNTGMGRHISI